MTTDRPVVRRAMVAVLAAAAVLSGTPGSAAEPANALSVRADDGARVISQKVLAPQVLDLVVDSPALGHTAGVRLFLPRSWKSSPTATYPELWLLSGSNDAQDYRSWDFYTGVRGFMAGKDVLTIMPSDGKSGIFTDEWNYGKPTGEHYETFHTVELVQLIERGFRGNGHRSVAGLSAGGLGAMNYAARHPGLFRAAASYSGLLNVFDVLILPVLIAVRTADNRDFYSLWGGRLLQFKIWKAHDPNSNVAALKGVDLYVSAGDGSQGPLDPKGSIESLKGGVVESYARGTADTFVATMKRLGVPGTIHLYAGGTHTWAYWQREFENSYPVLAKGMGAAGAGTVPSSQPKLKCVLWVFC